MTMLFSLSCLGLWAAELLMSLRQVDFFGSWKSGLGR
jgi:hypothetical protein